MKLRFNWEDQLFYLLPLCVLFSVVLTSVYSYHIKQDLKHNFKAFKFVIDTDSEFNASLIFTYSNKFDSKNKLNNTSLTSDTLLFLIPDSKQIIKKFRLDFGNDSNIKPITIKQLHLIFNDRVLELNQEEVFARLFNNSASVDLDKNNQSIKFIKDIQPFDPYIVFTPLVELVLQKSVFTLALLAPFFLLILFTIEKGMKQNRIKLLNLLVLLFIVCIPLKIAWTTLSTLLICLYGLIRFITKKEANFKNSIALVFAGIFCVLVLFGRPLSLSVIDMHLAYLLFAFLAATVVIPKFETYKFYAFFLLILNATILASGISFFLWLNDFYALGIIDYYENIKIHSGDIRNWLYYDHAAFLSFFGLAGMLLLQELHRRNQVNIRLIYLYHAFLLLFIILTATRICLIIYFVFLINTFLKWGYKKQILLNTLLYAVFAMFLIINIHKIDDNRYKLWSVTWEAIKQKPLFGYGLGQSNQILHSQINFGQERISAPLELNHSHNQFLTLLLEIGAVGFFILIGGFVFFLYKTKRYRDKTLVLFLFGLGYIFSTESILQTSKPLYVICFLFLIISTKESITKNLNK